MTQSAKDQLSPRYDGETKHADDDNVANPCSSQPEPDEAGHYSCSTPFISILNLQQKLHTNLSLESAD